MEITTMQMYWFLMLDNIKECIAVILGMCGIFFAVGIPILGAIGEEERFFPIAKRVLVVVVTLTLIVAFIPSTKQMASIVIVPKIANSEKVQVVGNKIYDLAVEWMEELKPSLTRKEER